MPYQDPTYNVTVQENIVGAGPSVGVSLGTANGTGTATTTYTGTLGSKANGTLQFPVWKDPKNIIGLRVYTVTAQGGGISGQTFAFLNGTATVGTCTPAASAGTYVDVTLTGSYTYNNHGIPAGAVLFTNTGSNEMTMTSTNTQTATASTLGTFAVDVLYRNLFVT